MVNMKTEVRNRNAVRKPRNTRKKEQEKTC